jgi:lysophospholipase L1-like esterase
LRIDVISEDQERPSVFGGFYGRSASASQHLPHRSRQIEFIGDSFTVGYGNTSQKRDCTDQEIWSTTDTSQGVAARVAARFNADYQVNAISGRGIVRNFNGSRGAPLPKIYPYMLFDQKRVYSDRNWRPKLIVIELGANDFSTALNPSEKWRTRAELRRDFENVYVEFVNDLRVRNPDAFILLWVAETGDSETTSEVANVADRLRHAGEKRLGFLVIRGLAFSGCNYHPSVSDDEVIAGKLNRFIDAQPRAWLGRKQGSRR